MCAFMVHRILPHYACGDPGALYPMLWNGALYPVQRVEPTYPTERSFKPHPGSALSTGGLI